MAGGRPTKYTDKLSKLICVKLMDGQSLRSVCKEEGMPERTTVHRWVSENEEFYNQYMHARDIQSQTLFDECLDISDDGSNDWMNRETKNGNVTVLDHEHVSRSKLRIDTRMHMVKLMAPKRYGDKSSLEVTGNDKGPIEIKTIITADMTPKEAAKAFKEQIKDS